MVVTVGKLQSWESCNRGKAVMTCSPLYHRTSEKRSEFTKLALASRFPKVPEGTRVDACAVLLMLDDLNRRGECAADVTGATGRIEAWTSQIHP